MTDGFVNFDDVNSFMYLLSIICFDGEIDEFHKIVSKTYFNFC